MLLTHASQPHTNCRAPNCWVVGLDVTHKCRITKQQLESLAGRGKYGTFLRDISQFYLQYHK